MKKDYIVPKIEWFVLSDDDIIRTSGQERLQKGEQGVEDHLSVAGL